MACTLHATNGPDRRPHDRRHRSAFGACRPAPRLGQFRGHGDRHTGGSTSFPKQPEGDRMLPLASPPPSRGRGSFPASGAAPAGLWREMMGRWLAP
jgi:hypothetical protein